MELLARRIGCLLVAICLMYCATARAQAPAAARPNIILIVADDLGYGDVGCFGSTKNRTPNIDRLAQEGMKLTSFYGCPVCTPSRAQFMTGSYAKRVSMPGVIFPICPTGLNPKENSLPKLLKPSRYASMALGKWHIGDQREFLPISHGFDHFFGMPYSNDMGGGEDKPTTQKATTKPGAAQEKRPPLPILRDNEVVETADGDKQNPLTARYTEEAIKFIKENREKPFFIYLAHNAVHVPLHPGAAFKGKSANGNYGDWVEELDWSVGQVVQTLRELKLDSRTLVMFTSDNGPWLTQGNKGGVAGPLRGGKGSTWEGGMREPTVAWWPGKIAPGSTSDAICSNLDLLPTFVKLSGGTVPAEPKIDGVDIWPVLSGSAKQSSREALFYFNGNTLQAVRSGPWKLALPSQLSAKEKEKEKEKDGGKTPRLYNLDKEIGETTDVAADNPEVVKKLEGLIAEMDKDLGATKAGPGVRKPGRVEKPEPLVLKKPL